MIGARKCQVKQVEREFYFTALTREDIADLFEGHWPTFATTNVVNNNNKYFTHTQCQKLATKAEWNGMRWICLGLSKLGYTPTIQHE